ncbi:MAG: PAS domain S-box protein [Candidatus Bathyarchaeia archaeon]
MSLRPEPHTNRRKTERAKQNTTTNQSKSALEDSALHHDLFDRTLDGVYLSTHEGRFVAVNPALVKMFGYSSKEEMLQIKDIKTALYFSPEERGTHIPDSGQEEVEVYRVRRKDGSEIWVEDHGSYIHGTTGRVLYHQGLLRDVTERIQRERALRESTEAASHLAAIVESSDDAIASIALDGVITSWNRGAEKLYGYSTEEAIGKPFYILVGPNHRDDINQIFERVKTGEAIHNYITQRIRKDCTTADVSLTISPIKDSAGTIIGSSSIARDITERKKMEEALRESEARYRKYFDLGLVGMALETAQGGWVDANNRLCEIFGYTREELFKKHWTELTHPDDIAKDSEQLGKLLRGEIERYSIEKRFIRKDGKVIDAIIAINSTRDENGKADLLFGFVVDITERKKMEVALRDSEEKYRSFVENANELITVASEKGVIVYANPLAEAFTGYTQNELIGKSLVDVLHPDDFKNVTRDGFSWEIVDGDIKSVVLRPGKRLEDSGSYQRREFRLVTKRGGVRRIDVNAALIQWNNRPAVLQFSTDITERKHLEEKLKSYAEHLEELVKERTAKLAESEERYRVAKERLEYVTTMNPAVVGISHPTSDKSDFHASFLSKSAKSVLGFEAEELVGKSGADFWESRIPVEDLLRFRAETPLLWRDGQHTFEYRFLHKDGGTRWIHEEQRVIRDSEGNPKDIVGYWTDVTEKKKLEEELRESEERYRIVADNTYDWEFWRTTEGKLIYCSPSCKRITGHTREEFLADPGLLNRIVHPDDQTMFVKHQDKVYTEQSSETIQFRIITSEEEVKWIEHACQPVFGEDGEFRGIRGSNRDATLRVQAEALEEKRKAEVAKKLNDITDRLQSLTQTREKLKTAPDVGTGLDVVLETVLWSFAFDCGAVFVLDRKANTASMRAAKARSKEMNLNQSYPLEGFSELKDVQAKSITKTVGKDESSILGTEIVHVIPIRAGTEIYGVLALGNDKQSSLEEEDVRILELYAELVYSFMIEKSMSLTPVLESKTEGAISRLSSSLEPGEMYLFKKNPADAFEVFTNTVFAGHQGLCVTRMYPPKVRSRYGIQKTPIVWLTNESTEGEQCMHSIQDLSIVIGDYLAKAEKAVVLIDGFEYLITNHGFEAFLRFLQILKNRVQRGNGIIIASIIEQTLAPRELALIEREMQLFGR